jgi:hypothetical protein
MPRITTQRFALCALVFTGVFWAGGILGAATERFGAAVAAAENSALTNAQALRAGAAFGGCGEVEYRKSATEVVVRVPIRDIANTHTFDTRAHATSHNPNVVQGTTVGLWRTEEGYTAVPNTYCDRILLPAD